MLGRTVAALVTVVTAGLLLVYTPALTNHRGGGAATASRRCIDNSACADLLGDCCPTREGDTLGCCRDAHNVERLLPASPTACADNSACASVAGECCPTAAGVNLDCCAAHDNVILTHITSSLCARNPGCEPLGLGVSCCPTDDGTLLSCCPPTPTSTAEPAGSSMA